MKYLTAGIEVCQGISSHGPSTVSQATGRELEYVKVSQATRLEFKYLKVSQATGLVSQATDMESEYVKVSEATGV